MWACELKSHNIDFVVFRYIWALSIGKTKVFLKLSGKCSFGCIKSDCPLLRCEP